MKIKHERNIINLLIASDSEPLSRIECISWSPNSKKIAICSVNNQVILFDGTNYEKKEKFALKSADKNFSRKSFIVKGLCFSPDSAKLAVGQIDCAIFVYKIGETWNEKKSIISKYSLQSPVTCLQWHQLGIIFGSAEGKVKLIINNSNKMSTLMTNNSMVISLSVCTDQVAAGYLNGAIFISTIGSQGANVLLLGVHSCPPFGLALSHSGYLCSCGCDGRISFNQVYSSRKQIVEYGSELTCAYSSPSGNSIIVSSADLLIIFTLESHLWKQLQVIELSGSHLITSLLFSRDGTKLMVGTVNGCIELFSCQWRRQMIGDKFEINYVGLNQVSVKDCKTNILGAFRSNYEIKEIKICRERFAVIWTTGSLIIGDIYDPNKISEIEWNFANANGIKFCFDYENVVLINVIGELYIVELGSNQMLSSFRTDLVNPHLMSIRINERKSDAKVFAYLLDIKTVSIIDLISGIQLCTWNHDEKIDWIELNETGKRLLFRDRSLRLHFLDILAQESLTLLDSVGFVQWVPGTDVVVAQSKDKIYVWYDKNRPEVHEVDAKCEAIGIERENGISKIVFNNNNNDIILNELLLEFDTAIDDGDLNRAVSFLETCNKVFDLESMWKTLGEVALKHSDLLIAERAFAAIGDVSKAAFIRDCFDNKYKLSLLENDWSTFETIHFDDAIKTYIQLHKWEKAIDLSIRLGHNDVKESLEKQYYFYLLSSNNHSEAAKLMEKNGKYEEAVKLYMQSGHLVQASMLIIELAGKQPSLSLHIINELIDDLKNAGLYVEAGRLYELPNNENFSEAFNLYIKAKCFPRAIDLARRHFPEEVVKLENDFGEYLIGEGNDPSKAVNHFIEAGKTEKALDAAIASGQYERAAEIASVIENLSPVIGKTLGEYYASRGLIDSAIEIYLNCGCIREAVLLLNSVNQFNRAYKLASKLMDKDEAKEMYVNIAKSMEENGKYKEAEKIYLTCGEVDLAISMYKNKKLYDPMISLVKQYHPDLLVHTHLHLAKELEAEGMYAQAESNYVAGSEWKSAVKMYKNIDKWEEAYRVARSYGGVVPAKQVAYLWAKSMPNIENSVKLLGRFGLLNQVVDYAIECNAFEFANALVTSSGPGMKHKVNEVKHKYALWLQEEGRLEEAEKLFIESNRAKEALMMYLNHESFDDAIRIAENYIKDENSISEVLVTQAKHIINSGLNLDNMNRAETLLLRAGRIELAVKMYKEFGIWDEALRVCEQYSPTLIDSVKRDMISKNSEHIDSKPLATASRGSLKSKDKLISSSFKDIKSELEASEALGDRESITRNVLILASHLLSKKNTEEALNLINKYPSVLLHNDSKTIFCNIVSEIFSFENGQEPDLSTWKQLRNCCTTIASNHPEETIEKYLLISHYFLLKNILKSLLNYEGAVDLLTKLTISLLRYTDIIRVDKAFFEAGQITKDNSMLEMAFVFWNHYLDLVDAIEEGELNVDHTDFEATDIPFEVPLPSTPYANEQLTIEEVKNWILQVSMDTRIKQILPIDNRGIYEASLINRDGTKCLPCLISGYPVMKSKMLELVPGKYAANRDDWNKLLMLAKISSNQELKDILLYIGKLCGNATIARFSF